MRDDPQLIAYADRFGGSIAGVGELLDGPLAGAFAGVHLLPFYTPFDGSDAGFDPTDHTAVDPRLGTWSDVAALAATRTVMADVIVNHVSRDSPQFRDVVERGSASSHASMFLTYDAVFPSGACEADLLAVYRPRPGLPFTPVTLAGRTRRLAWTTFTSDQIDLDVSDPQAVAYLESVLVALSAAGVRQVRMDAVGYAVKTPGTSCFLTPETLTFIAALTERAHALGLEVLVELHSHYARQVEISAGVDRVYDFALPPLLLHALYTGDATALRGWIDIRPHNCVSVLDTHDGIGVVDVGADLTDPGRAGLLEPDAIVDLVDAIHQHSRGASRMATGAAASNVDVYQVNSTYYDALGRDDARYLLARAVQVFLPGIPQIYYVGLLAGHNDLELLARTRVGRDINRTYYSPERIAADLQRPVVARLVHLLRWRCAQSAFSGTFSMLPGNDDEPHRLTLRWDATGGSAELVADVRTGDLRLSCSAAGSEQVVTDLADLSL